MRTTSVSRPGPVRGKAPGCAGAPRRPPEGNYSPQGIPVLRLDDDIASRSPVARQQGIHPVLAVGQRFPPDVSLQHAALRLETLERKVGQFGRQNLGLSVVRTGDVEHGVIHKNYDYVKFSYLRTDKVNDILRIGPGEMAEKYEKVGRDQTALPHLHKTGKTVVGEHRGVVHARPETVRALHSAHVRRRAGQGRGADDPALHGLALRPGARKDLAGTGAERRKELLQLPHAERPDRVVAGGVRPRAQVRTAAPPTCSRPTKSTASSPRRTPRRPRGCATAPCWRPSIRADCASRSSRRCGCRTSSSARVYPRDRQGRQTAARADQRRGAGPHPALPRKSAAPRGPARRRSS